MKRHNQQGLHEFVYLSALRVKACRYCGIVEDGWNVNNKCPKVVGTEQAEEVKNDA